MKGAEPLRSPIYQEGMGGRSPRAIAPKPLFLSLQDNSPQAKKAPSER